MNFLRIFAILIAMVFSVSAISEDTTPVKVTQEEVCTFFGSNAIEFATIYTTPGNTKEDVAEHIVTRNQEHPVLLTFLPGELMILGVMLNFQPERYTPADIAELGKTTYEMCMATITVDSTKWVQAIPGASKIIEQEDDEFETDGPSVVKKPKKVIM